MSFLPWLISAIIAAGSAALIYRLMDERRRESMAFLNAHIAELNARNTKLESDIVKRDELIEILWGERTDLNRSLGQEEGTFAAKLRAARLRKQIKEVNKDDEPQPPREEAPPADWMSDDEQ